MQHSNKQRFSIKNILIFDIRPFSYILTFVTYSLTKNETPIERCNKFILYDVNRNKFIF